MGREESERVAAIVNMRPGSLATYMIRPRMNHHFDTFADPVAAFREEGGAYGDGAAKAMVVQLRGNRRLLLGGPSEDHAALQERALHRFDRHFAHIDA